MLTRALDCSSPFSNAAPFPLPALEHSRLRAATGPLHASVTTDSNAMGWGMMYGARITIEFRPAGE